MAGHNSPSVNDEKIKKRKRGVSDGDTKPKRHRQQHQHVDKTGFERRRPEKAPESNKLRPVDSIQDVVSRDSMRRRDHGEAGWRISKPMGGRMLDIDPLLTADERHLILAYNTSVQVFNATNSLLVRRIPICSLDSSAPQGSIPAAIIAVRLSKRNPDYVWVACSNGQVYSVNWTDEVQESPSFRTVSGTAKAMAVVPAANQNEQDIILITESERQHEMEVVAYQGKVGSSVKNKKMLTLKKSGQGLHLLEVSEDGLILAGIFHDRLFLGTLSPPAANGLNEFHCEMFSFDAPDMITALDLRCYARPSANRGKERKREAVTGTLVDLLAGGARGHIYVYRDVLARLQAVGKPQHVKDSVQVHMFHWHRTAVHSVKWSRDGNYFISGGSENVLVIWQVDTSKQNFLPHLSGSVENIVVSASGSSYVLHLDDNSAMIISTAEMKPTAFISGIQTATIDVATPKDSLVERIWNVAGHVRRPIPAAIRPSDPSKLHVCVGNGRQATMSGEFSAPLLQTFDLDSFTGVSKQALARTHPTDVKLNNSGHVIDEPLVTHLAFSNDGKWLASVDEWKPPTRDVELVSNDQQYQLIRERHEIYLRFWQIRDDDESLALVSRTNAPHRTSHPEAVLDLVSDPTATCFASIGADGVVRFWRPKSRQQNGVAVKDEAGQNAVHWSCSQMLAIGEHPSQELTSEVSDAGAAPRSQGSLAFSEDGSTLFAAFGVVDTGLVYVIDKAANQVVKIIDGLWGGQLHAVRALSSFVIVLSDELRVYDVVGDELRYGIVMSNIPGVHELLQLSVDRHSGCFAVTLPIGDFSSVGVFDPTDSEPLMVHSIPHRIVSLISAPSASGFIVLDDTAQTWVIAEGSDPAAVATMQPLLDMKLDDAREVKELNFATDNAVMGSDDEMEDHQPERDEDEDEDEDMDEGPSHAAVVPQQHLAAIFDASPAFAAPSIEDLFYQVADVLAAKPRPAVST